MSVDGDEQKNESIETQIDIAKAFVRKQKDIVIFDCYTDIGRTGTNFEREGFARMMRDVRMRKIDCVIVKDLSRFGRNHIEMGNYLEKIFPFLGVRFIAVTDGFDSMNVSGKNEAFGVNLKNLVNEMYARDIAVKVKSGRKVKSEQGSYTGGAAPYGYRVERIGDKRCLFIEEKTADIVKRMFELFLSGKTMKEIAVWLYEKRIVRPSEYHKKGEIYCQEGCELLQWPRGTIKMILMNPVYMGCTVRESTVEKHTHEAIVSEDIFYQAAARQKRASENCRKEGFSETVPIDEDIFADVLYCGDCGAKMKRHIQIKAYRSEERARVYSYSCPRHDRIDVQKCVTKSIALSTLAGVAGKAIRQEFALSDISPKKLMEANRREAERMKGVWDSRIYDLERKRWNLTKLESEQYMKYRMEEMNESAFRRAKEEYEKQTAVLEKKQAELAEKLKALDAQTERKNDLVRTLLEGSGKTELTAEIVRTLIHRIEVYPDHRVKIIFAFKRREPFV